MGARRKGSSGINAEYGIAVKEEHITHYPFPFVQFPFKSTNHYLHPHTPFVSQVNMDITLFGILFFPLLPALYLFLNLHSTQLQYNILESAVVALGGFVVAYRLIPVVAKLTLDAQMFGMDLNKKGSKMGDVRIPEGLGIVVGTVFLICVILFQVFQSFHFFGASMISSLVEYNAALTSICMMILLGFADDVLNLRWRYKLVLPAVATLPLLVAYQGGTSVVVPIPLREIFGQVLDLGLVYKLYLLLLAIFCTNSINILAGLNGLEVGQSIIIAVSIITHNLVELTINQGGPNTTVFSTHVMSLFFMIPYLATSISLILYNWYPSRVFVGDTYTYFSGMCFAVVAILCHFSKTLLLFFIPQIINFLYSLIQLFGIIPCPRHRLPKYNNNTGKLEGIPTNLNLINLFLIITGPLSERTLCVLVLSFQVLCCIGGFVIRYYVAGLVF
eukprot:TRINITY_DN3864_c0_g1_i3.p1 TRINITY_DN3864_c0_g1~~TRINITY_DN3864_c0_g1_i3.p1  ORF type:complete len:445 (+),score=73.20 TRINITY_DN3864_c0_g1_i3:3-1337(+)